MESERVPDKDSSVQAADPVNKPSGAGRAELVAFVSALAALTAVILWLAHGWILVTRPLWVDECFTLLVASHATPWEVIADLRAGADGGAGLFHLLMWLLRAFTGPLRPVNLHLASLACMLAAIIVVYAVLRRRFPRDASVAGALAMGVHGIVVAMSYEGRFYALWLLCCAWVAWQLGAVVSRKRDVSLAIAAALLVTSHWYGVVTLCIMAGTVWISSWPNWRAGLRTVAPAAAGLAMFAAIWPLATGQRAVLTVSSWVPDFTMGQLHGLIEGFWLAKVPVAGAVAIAIAMAIRWRRDSKLFAVFAPARDAGVLALLALAIMPLALSVMSLVGQPSMLGRYALPAALSWAPWVALGFAAAGRWPSRAAALAAGWLWYGAYVSEVDIKRKFTIGLGQEATALRHAETMRVPVVLTTTHTLYPLVIHRRMLGPLPALLDLPDSTLDKFMAPTMRFYQINKGVRLDRDFARVHATRFGFPPLATQAALDSTPIFVVLDPGTRVPRGMSDFNAYWRLVFPRYRATQVDEMLTLFEREDASNRPARNTSR